MSLPDSKFSGSKVSLRDSARRFAKCLSRDDVDLHAFAAATSDLMVKVERFGDFTARGVSDARQNLQRVEQARAGRFSSMRALLMDQVRLGARRPEGGPASSTAAEALLWSRLGIKFWVEMFKDHLRAPQKKTLQEAMRNGFKASIGRYLDRFGRAAFNMATRSTPDWDDVRRRTHLGCENGVCSDEELTKELRTFVRDVEPVLDRMTKLQKSVGLEDPRTA